MLEALWAIIWTPIKSWLDFKYEKEKQAKEDTKRAEVEAWQWMERHLKPLEKNAQRIYSIVFPNKVGTVQDVFSEEAYPFVCKMAQYPTKKFNVFVNSYQKLEKTKRQQVWCIGGEYLKIWDECLAQFPVKPPQLPYDRKIFEKTAELFRKL